MIPFIIISLLLVGWISSEFRGARWHRITLGLILISGMFLWCIYMVVMQVHDTEVKYGEAVGDLVSETVKELGTGNSTHVLDEMKKLYGTYENFGTDRHLIYLRETTDRLRNPLKVGHDPRMDVQ